MSNPKRAVAAMTTVPARVGGIVMRDLTAGTYLILQKLASPLVTTPPGQPVELSDLDAARLIYILAHEAGESYDLLQRGTEAFDAAVIRFADGIPMDRMPEIQSELRRRLHLAQSTAPSGPGGAFEKKTAATTDRT